MRVVVLGGTGFLSGAVVDAALARGHDVVTVTRGRSGSPPAGVLALHADRDDGAALGAELRRAALPGADDVVVDTSGYTVAGARAAAESLAGVARYVYVSSISAYRDWPPGPVPDESAPTWPPDADRTEYGPMKAESERVLGAVLGDRFLAVRAGLIVGPGDRTRRLTWWLDRFARHERVVVPARREQPTSFVDARDLAAWVLDAAERGLGGAATVAGPPGSSTVGELVDACRDAVLATEEVAGEPVPVPDEELLAHGVQPWTDLPFWVPADMDPMWSVGTDRAVATGLRVRPLQESVRDTWAWLRGTDLEHPALPDALAELTRRRGSPPGATPRT